MPTKPEDFFAKYFKQSEFACHCGCGNSTMSALLLDRLDALRAELNTPIRISSGFRCLKHNRSVGSSDGSQHPKGTAADIMVKGYTPSQIYAILEEKFPTSCGIGKYKTFVHFDVRAKRARW